MRSSFDARVFFLQAKIAGMGTEEDVARQPAKDAEHTLVVSGDLRISGVVDEFIAGIHVGTADYHDVINSCAVLHLHGPRGAAFGVAGSEMGDEGRAAENHFIAIAKDAIDFGGRIKVGGIVAIVKIGAAAGFDDRDIASHDHVAGAGQFFDLGAAGIVVPMGVADEQNLNIGELEAEAFHARLDQREILREITVDENVPLRCRDQIVRQSFAADVIQVAGDAKGRKRLGPVGALGASGRCGCRTGEEHG